MATSKDELQNKLQRKPHLISKNNLRGSPNIIKEGKVFSKVSYKYIYLHDCQAELTRLFKYSSHRGSCQEPNLELSSVPAYI